MNDTTVINVVFAGLGGQGVLKASDILAEVAFRSGLDVKKSELHGMSQRGGSVSSDVRFGKKVWSPMIPAGSADYLILLQEDQLEPNQHVLKPDGRIIKPSDLELEKIPNKKSINVALLGILSRDFDFSLEIWHEVLRKFLPEKVYEANLVAFAVGRGEAAVQV
jgi:indolepyruvate ferredoxin oxidoreductase beta subunit